MQQTMLYPFLKLQKKELESICVLGNERKIDYLLNCIQRFLEEVGYVHNGEYKKNIDIKLRQLTLFIIFNTNLPILKEMKDFASIELLVSSSPNLSRYVMCEVLWNLKINNVIGEILIYTYPKLALEVTESFLDHTKYFFPNNCLEKLVILTGSSYKLLYKLNYTNADNATISQAYKNFQKAINLFVNPPNVDRLDGLAEDDLYEYMGKRLYKFLYLYIDCLNVFTKRKILKNSKYHDVYQVTMPPLCIKQEDISGQIDIYENENLLDEYLFKSNVGLVETCNNLLTEISIDMFCSWSEFEENGISLQNIIGKLAYTITTNFYEFMNNIEPAWTMLELISTKPPKEPREEINIVESKIIEEKILENSAESIEWLKASVYRDKLSTEDSLLRCIYSKQNLLTCDENNRLYKCLYENLKNNNYDNEFLKLFAVKCLELCDSDVKEELVEKHFSNSIFEDTLTTDIFDSMMTQIFNKLISVPENDLSDIYTIFIQSPKKVFARIFDLACENIQQVNIMIKVMEFLDKYKGYHYNDDSESCLLLLVNEKIESNLHTDTERDNFIKFIDGLKNNNIVSGSKLLFLIIMPSLCLGIKSHNLCKVALYCKLLLKSYKPREYQKYRAPILVTLAQILDIVRWKIDTFDAQKPTVLDLILELVLFILNTYESNIPEKDCEWLKLKLTGLNPLNMYYYRSLWNPPGNTYINVISGVDIQEDINPAKIILWLSQQFCSTSLQEWYNMWDSLVKFERNKILYIFHEAISIIIKTENLHRSENTEACVLYCFKNYISILKNKYIKLPLDNDQVRTVCNYLVDLDNCIEVSNTKEIETILLPIFSFIAERRTDHTINVSHNLYDKLKIQGIKTMCGNIFMNNSNYNEK